MTGCALRTTDLTVSSCAQTEWIGAFNPATDVFVGYFDSKPDVDDLHSIAAVGSLLKQEAFGCVRAVGVAGAYGTQGGDYIDSPKLFDLAFGENWLDGHHNRDATIAALAELIIETLEKKGAVWGIIAGQGDLAADALSLATDRSPDLPYSSKVHFVQHSDWNESVTTPVKLEYLKEHADYIKIADGNGSGNGTPNYTWYDGGLWPRVLTDPNIGEMWREAKRLADEKNPTAAYVNPAVEAGGFDFSDVVEMAHIFDLNAVETVPFFFDFVLGETAVEWPNGAKAAIALTYDDALASQIETALRQLNELGLKATFYVSLASQGFGAFERDWAQVARDGHELGNHSVVHPCRGSLPDREWVAPNRDLDSYSKAQLLDELRTANDVLSRLDPATGRTFAYMCGDTTVSGESFIADLKPMFPGARSVVRNSAFEPYFIPSFAVNETSSADMIAYVDELIARQAVGSITFHDVGGTHLPVTAQAHAELLAHLVTRKDEIWVAPLRDILEWREAQRN